MAFFTSIGVHSHDMGPASSPQYHLHDIAEFLRRTPDAWTTKKEARTGDGSCVDPLSPWARAWCTLGLLERFIPRIQTRQVALGMLMRVIPRTYGVPTPVHAFNDAEGRTVSDVIAALELASKIPAGEPMTQDEYGEISRQYHVTMQFRAASGVGHNDVNPLMPTLQAKPLPKAPDWKAIISDAPLPVPMRETSPPMVACAA
jgi:hypothetical protein